ncbi:hypothetical protein CsatB_005723 [Cannabis sativa]
MGKSSGVCNVLLVAILVLVALSDNKIVVMGDTCRAVISDYSCKQGGFDQGCQQRCIAKYPVTQSACVAPSGALPGVFYCTCNYPC